MTWHIDEKNPSKAYIRSVKYRIKAHEDKLCITDRKPLAPTSKVYCVACLTKHSLRVKSYNRRKKENKLT